MLLGESPVAGYRGVDRSRFEPSLADTALGEWADVDESNPRIWHLTPAGWRREAYRLYEENLAFGCGDDLFLIRTYRVARELQELIRPYVGAYEILGCHVYDLSLQSICAATDAVPSAGFLGYDVAYPGGDCYSAVLNGLLLNPHQILVADFASMLGAAGLFESADVARAYLARFRALVPSEADSEFRLFAMCEPEATETSGS